MASKPRSASVAYIQRMPDSRQRKNIEKLLLYGLTVNGRTIDELGTKPRGRPAQNAWRSKPVWHRKADLDRRLAEEMHLPSTVWGPRRKSNELMGITSEILNRLRKSGTLSDWSDRRTDLYRLSDPSMRVDRPSARVKDCWPEPEPIERTERNMRKTFTAIISEGRRDNTYKFALCKTLLDYCRGHAPDGSARKIKYEYLAGEFLRHYWHQKYKFRMKQDFHTKRQPRIITILEEVFGDAQSASFRLAGAERKRDAKQRILADVFGHDRQKKGMVVPRLQHVRHGSTTASVNMFYDYDDDLQVITLHPEAHAFLRHNHKLLTRALLAEWVLYLERVNHGMPKLAAKIDGIKKQSSLKKYKDILYKYAKNCFYCENELEPDCVHVDHFIPWSYMVDDDMWNLVLACAECNLDKSNSLPKNTYLSGLITRNEECAGLKEMKESLCRLAVGTKTWEEEIRHHYSICGECGFGRWEFAGSRP